MQLIIKIKIVKALAKQQKMLKIIYLDFKDKKSMK